MSGQGKRVLLFGAGLVVRPMVHYLSGHGYSVTVASRTLEKAKEVCNGAGNALAVECDVTTKEGEAKVHKLVPDSDAVVSMLPYVYHPQIAKSALQFNKHFLTTSYVSDTMKTFNDEAVKKGLTFINECGVDPGTDHMSAMQVIDKVKEKGGRIVGFSSYCGGLPAPEDNDNPLGYKFSWSPRGVLLASRNSAKFLADGKEAVIDGKDLFDNFKVEHIEELKNNYEGYYNRDSLSYIDTYGLDRKYLKNMMRGTYRNVGWCQTVKKLVDLNFLDLTERKFNENETFFGLLKHAIGYNNPSGSVDDVKAALAKYLKISKENKNEYILNNFSFLGFFDEKEHIPKNVTTILDALCQNMLSKMQYKEGERDMLLMRHTFDVEYENGTKEILTCTLVDFGIKNGDTSMSRTVSLPVAIAVRLVLEKKFTKVGLQLPIVPELYNPILEELEKLGIKFVHGKK